MPLVFVGATAEIQVRVRSISVALHLLTAHTCRAYAVPPFRVSDRGDVNIDTKSDRASLGECLEVT